MEASDMVAEPGSLFVWGGELPGVPLMIDAADGAQVLALGAPVEGGGAPVALLAEEGISWLSSSGEPVSSLVQAGHRAEEAAVVDADSGIAVCRCVVGHSRAQPPAREADAELDAGVASRLAQAAEAQAVGCGRKHLLILSRDGSVFACGANEHGQCGLGHNRAVALPLPSPTLRGKRVVAISCGEAHSAALTDDGVLFTFGRGSEGQLGLGRSSRRGHLVGESTGDVLAPRCVAALERMPVAAVACGARFTVVALRSGEASAGPHPPLRGAPASGLNPASGSALAGRKAAFDG
ncbi:Herc6, partial [Symbiodinium sp. KB8]